MGIDKPKGRTTPTVVAERAFLNVVRDFTRPLDAIREAISNALDFHADRVYIKVWEDKKMPGGELVIEIEDNGDGMEVIGLEAFFNLADSTHIAEDGTKLEESVGEKGHGTKTYFNSRQIEVFTKSKSEKSLYALMDEPLKELLQRRVPPYDYDTNPGFSIARGTKVIIKGFNQSVKRNFSHRVLKDHIMWLTKFADFSWVFESSKPKTREDSSAYQKGPRLFLHGLGYDEEWEEIGFGHVFPAEQMSMNELKKRILLNQCVGMLNGG